MRYLAAGFGVTIGCALISLGWAGWELAMHHPENLPAMPPRGGRAAVAICSVLVAGLGTSLAFAAVSWVTL